MPNDLPPGFIRVSVPDPLNIVTIGDAPPVLGGPYIVKGMLAHKQVGLLIGQPACGKSTLGPRIAHAVARGEPVLGHKTAQGPVLWVAGEDHVGVIRRFHALNREIADAPGIHVTTASLDMLATGGPLPGAREVIEAADGIGATLIVVDTLAACCGPLDENDARSMGAAVAALRSLASPTRAVLCIHHTPKTGTTPRGHGVLLGAADLVLLVEAQEDGERTLRPLKNRNGPSVGSWRFTIRGVELGRDDEGDVVTAPMAEFQEGGSTTAHKRSLARKTALALRMLHAAVLAKGEPLPEAWRVPGEPRGVPLEAWREECERQALSDSPEATAKAFRRALDDLRLRGLIGIREHLGTTMVWPTRGEE